MEKEVEGKHVWIVWFDSLKASIYAYFYLSDLSYKVRFIRGASHFKNSLANSPNQAVAGAQMTEYMGYNQGYQQSPIYQSNPYQQHYQPNEYQQGYMQGYQGGYGYYPSYSWCDIYTYLYYSNSLL